MNDIIVGIDLGTTNSEIAIYRDGRPVVLADDAGRLILPSVVGLADDGSLLVGEEARNQYLLHPDRTIRSIKRRMGRDEKVRLGERDYAPQEISAMILRRLKEIAEARLGHPIAKAVITVPAYFSDAQRQATREAGEIAGLEPVRILNEPTAAALTYEAGHREGKRVVVYDLGGGTFDVSVVRIQDGVVEVISGHGNNHLGGDDFDAKLVGHILDHLKIKQGIDVSDDLRAMARITRTAEAAKKRLSDEAFCLVAEEYLTESDGKPIHLSLEITRPEYEEMISPFIEETLEAVHVALKGAGMAVSEVDEILLVGGATRTPLVQHRLEETFGMAPRGEVDPDLCVALGAAIQGAAIAGEEVSAVLVDVTPYTFGISVLGEVDGDLYPYRFAPIIHKNTPIPVRRSEMFYTTFDDQDTVEINVFQGEHQDARENIQIGEFKIVGLSKAPAGNPIIVDLALDRDGILQVTAKEKKTGLQQRIVIDKAMARLGEGDLAEARSRIGGFFDQLSSDAEVPEPANDDLLPFDVSDLITRAEGKLDDAGEEDRTELIDLIETIRDARKAGDRDRLADACEQLKDLIFYLET
jgi:molecular chaperone DnaK (HSP70)